MNEKYNEKQIDSQIDEGGTTCDTPVAGGEVPAELFNRSFRRLNGHGAGPADGGGLTGEGPAGSEPTGGGLTGDGLTGGERCQIDMNQIAGSHDILFLCLDTLRYDVAVQEEKNGGTPVLNRYGPWEKCQAPGNFTYPSHHAMFAGFLPCSFDAKSIADRRPLFFPINAGMGRKAPPGAYGFAGATIMEGLEKDGYDTWCVGGVAFFDKRSDLGRVFPGYFRHSYWNPSFSCPVKESTKNQVDFILKKLKTADPEVPLFLYVNIDAIHYPNYFYLEGASRDSAASHAAALRYVDRELGRLFDAWRTLRGDAFVICCSDHGTCYGEDGCQFHGINHPAVTTVPYKHFLLNHKNK